MRKKIFFTEWCQCDIMNEEGKLLHDILCENCTIEKPRKFSDVRENNYYFMFYFINR